MGIMRIFINSTSVDVPITNESVTGIRHGIEIPSAEYAPCQVKPMCVEWNAHSNTLYTNNNNYSYRLCLFLAPQESYRLQYGRRK